MKRKKLLWQIYFTYLLVTLIALFTVGWYTSSSFKKFYYSQGAVELEVNARFLVPSVAKIFIQKNAHYLDSLCKKLGNSTRITLILPSGEVIGDSEKDISKMDNHIDRPEIIDALNTGRGLSTRYSHTLKEGMMYLAIPIREKDKIIGILRTAKTLTAINNALIGIYSKMALGWILTGLLIAVVNLLISRSIVKPLEDMKRGTERFAKGDLEFRLPVPNLEEVGSLAEEMNRMASYLSEKIYKLAEQNNEKEALLSSMVEGVLAVDTNENIIFLNKAAYELFSIDDVNLQGRSLQEIIRNSRLRKLVRKTLKSDNPVLAEITLRNSREVQIHGTLLRDVYGQEMGVLIVFNDVTRIRHLENLRSDFVANVSHELKTPITSIKGFIETLQDGAIEKPNERKHFLDIVQKQSDRLLGIIEDLLNLSRLERDEKKDVITLEECKIKDVMKKAIRDCEVKMCERNISINLKCSGDIYAKISSPLIEQAIVNLLDNAVNYSEPNGVVDITASQTNTETIISICDKGCGIAKEHLERLFERFYRVDKARSRKLGGTGLGLSIVKHIAQAHKGRVEVESTPFKGSTFSVHIPNSKVNI